MNRYLQPRPYRLRRSCLAVPGSNTRMIEKAQSLPVDQVFLDLEDSVAPSAKAQARDNVVSALRDGDWAGKTRVVRVNDCTTQWTYRDVTTVVGEAGDRLDCILLPKVQESGQVAFVDYLITQIEREKRWEVGRIGLELQVEDAAGLVNARSILESSPRIETFIFGPGDMAAALRMPSLTVGEIRDDYPGDHWHWVLFTILVQARHAGVQAIDGPFAHVKDLEGFRRSAARSRILGFDGKWVVHPSQIDAANEIFGEDLETIERAVDIMDAFAAAAEGEGRGAVLFGAEMIDEASRKLAVETVRRGERFGLSARSTPPDIPFHERQAWRRENLPG